MSCFLLTYLEFCELIGGENVSDLFELVLVRVRRVVERLLRLIEGRFRHARRLIEDRLQ